MKKHQYSLLVLSTLFAAGIILNGCGENSTPEESSIFSENAGSQEDNDQNPNYDCSIKVPDPEPSDLSSLAEITYEQAKEAALAAYPGATVTEVELDNENGCLVYSVELNNGLEVKVDAGNAAIVHIESDNDSDDSEEGGTGD